MPFISLVVPVYQVEAYLRVCLESILEQPFQDFELILVDDCSPDHSSEIIADFAAQDSRIKTISLDANAGLGMARNRGFESAAGDYVWFIDSDDWLAEGSLEAVAERLLDTKPDVLVVDYARVHFGSRIERNVNAPMIGSAPDTFSLDGYPELLNNFVAAWNKVVRSDFLRDLGLSFPDGYYEDIPFTYPLLAQAERISTLDRVCIYYRQRRNGNILGTTSRRHLQLFDQYELAMARVADPVVRQRIAYNAIDHGSTVLGIAERIPARSRREFFDRLVAFGRQHNAFRPGLRDRLLERGAWFGYSTIKRLKRALPKFSWRSVARRIRLSPQLAYYWWHRRHPLEDLAVYCSYWGRAYECNPAAVHAAAKRLAPHVKSVWAVNRDQLRRLPDGVAGVVIGSFGYYRAMARARWAISNANFEGEIVKRTGSIHVQTHHGTPLKLMGVDEPRFSETFGKLLKRCDRWDFSLSSNRYSTETWARAYPCDFETLEFGYPRNDVLVNATPAEVEALRSSYPDGLLVLYAPTFRESGGPPEPLRIPGATVLAKQHYFEGADEMPSIEELMLVSDVLVTDYSSVMFDYALLDRPIVIYAPDWAEYRVSRGVYFDLFRHPPGVAVQTMGELLAAFECGAVFETAAQRAAFRNRIGEFDDGRAAERVVRRVFLGQHC